jgi:hypothetical protein
MNGISFLCFRFHALCKPLFIFLVLSGRDNITGENEKKHKGSEKQAQKQNFEKETKRSFLPQKFPKHFPEKNRIKILWLNL